MARVLMASNRLPISVRLDGGTAKVERSTGGLATGLGGVHDRGESLWVGWPGVADDLPAEQARALDARYAELGVVPVPLSADEVRDYYEAFCNGVLWPLLHYMVDQLPLEIPGFELYERVNRRFADAIAAQHRPGDLVWIHDYQLMLVPQLLRERIPEARIGFFLHVPFPSSDVFRTLPFRERLLEGLLGADLVGFHTAAYMRHFASSVLRTLGAATDVDRLRWDDRTVHLGVFPMGVDARGFAALADAPDMPARVEAIRTDGRQLLVGIDRLDYTKGIPRRLLAYEQLLRKHPELRERVRFVQVAVPSRTNVDKYQEFRDGVDKLIGHIDGQFATPSWVPVHYIFRGLPPEEVAALYRAADVMLVTPIRDGMNLVAKEFVAARTDGGGVLVLSEFAGASSELPEAIHVNPYDIAGTAEAFYRALTMPEDERRGRMRALRRHVETHDVQRWAATFLTKLAEARPERSGGRTLTTPEELRATVARLRDAPELVLLLDYDGTLVPFAPTPDLARPDPALLALLERLALRPRTALHVVSGRTRDSLEGWLGGLPLSLHAEHGLWSRPPGGPGRETLELPPMAWRDPVHAILCQYADRTPGALVETKRAGFAWHHRGADPEFGAFQAKELRLHLGELLSNAPVEILPGHQVIEVRAYGVHKGRVVAPIAARHPGALFAAFGDDRTDEDLFAALPAGSVSVHVGPGPSRAELRVGAVADVRALLAALVA